jgi:hypothetical protein
MIGQHAGDINFAYELQLMQWFASLERYQSVEHYQEGVHKF